MFTVIMLGITLLISNNGGLQMAEAALCPMKSNGHNRCYAIDEFSTFPSYPMKGLKGKNTVYDRNVAQGMVVSSNWVLFNNGKIFESLWRDDYGGTTKKPYYACGVNIVMTATWGTPANGTQSTFEVSDTDSNGVWTISAAGSSPTGCSASDSGGTAYVLKTGYETNYDNGPITTNDYNTLQVFSGGFWYMWQGVPIGGHSANVDPGFFVKYCGTGSEQYYHHKHGKGTAPATC